MPRAASTRRRERTIAELVARYERKGTIVRDALDAAARVVDDDAGAEEVVEATREATREATARRREDARETRARDGRAGDGDGDVPEVRTGARRAKVRVAPRAVSQGERGVSDGERRRRRTRGRTTG